MEVVMSNLMVAIVIWALGVWVAYVSNAPDIKEPKQKTYLSFTV